MDYPHRFARVAMIGVLSISTVAVPARGQEPWRFLLPEQRSIEIRDPATLPKVRFSEIPDPPTVTDPQPEIPVCNLSLDEALRTALANSEVIRLLGGSSGQTIYDPAIVNTEIDQARAAFDPNLQVNNNFFRRTPPVAGFINPLDPSSQVLIEGTRTDSYNMGLGLSKQTVTGGTAALGVDTTPTRIAAGGLPLNPQTSSSVDLSYTQPLLQGGGVQANIAPILIGRIDTERSFFQMKDAVQQMVRGVVQAYWELVFARTDLWVRQQQVTQGQQALERAVVLRQVGMGNLGNEAQARSSLATFRAALIAAEANVLRSEATLRNILGIPPSDGRRLVPVTPPATERVDVDWQRIVDLAARQRPDLIELKLILEADQQQLILAKNQALPRVDAVGVYTWDGLQGRTPDRSLLASRPGEFTGWQLGVNFSVPLGLRQARAGVRQQELVIMRDRANLEQGFHNATHTLAARYRNLASYYDQYLAFREARAASKVNLDVQDAEFRASRTIYLNVLQAITNWGNAISSEAQSVTLYNTELANLAQDTGTILDAHGIRFAEERYASIGPLGRAFAEQCYPKDMHPTRNTEQYPTTTAPAEDAFHLSDSIPTHTKAKTPTDAPSRFPSVTPPPDLQFVPPPSPEAQFVPPPPTAPQTAPPSAPQTAPQRLQLDIPAYRPEAIPTPRPNP